jgi:Arc/MetJ-type ribon-helix-helix transcriptional regulator
MSVVSVIQDNMKTLTVRLPDELATQIDRESRERRISKSDIVRERLSTTRTRVLKSAVFDAIADLIGSVDGLPADLSTREKQYLKATGYGKKRHR